MDKVVKSTIILAVMSIMAAGCSNPDAISPHSAADDAAINKYKSMTPEQKIDLIQKGAMPAAAKQAQIDKIKAQAGIK